MPSEPVVLALISAGGPAILVLFVWLRDRQGAGAKATADLGMARKSTSEGDASLATVTLEWARELRAEVADLKSQVAALHTDVKRVEAENRLLRRHNELLSEQVIGLGGVPIPMPRR